MQVEFGHEVRDPSQLPEADLIVACDGVNSRTRIETEGFQTDVQLGSNRYIWLGTDKVFESFTFPFVPTDSGWVWAHAYGIDAKTSTFIVECTAETYAGLGFDTMPPDACLSVLEKIFAGHLDGHQLIGQFPDGTNAPWLNFRTVTNQRWYQGRTVLAGDAAHTTHFTIGSGTKLAIEDAIALAGNLQRYGELESRPPVIRTGTPGRDSCSRKVTLASARSGSRTSLATSTSDRTRSSRSCMRGDRYCCRASHRGFIISFTVRHRKSLFCADSGDR